MRRQNGFKNGLKMVLTCMCSSKWCQNGLTCVYTSAAALHPMLIIELTQQIIGRAIVANSISISANINCKQTNKQQTMETHEVQSTVCPPLRHAAGRLPLAGRAAAKAGSQATRHNIAWFACTNRLYDIRQCTSHPPRFSSTSPATGWTCRWRRPA